MMRRSFVAGLLPCLEMISDWMKERVFLNGSGGRSQRDIRFESESCIIISAPVKGRSPSQKANDVLLVLVIFAAVVVYFGVGD